MKLLRIDSCRREGCSESQNEEQEKLDGRGAMQQQRAYFNQQGAPPPPA